MNNQVKGLLNDVWYQDMIVDFRGIPVMFFCQYFGCYPFLQQPNQASGVTGGRPEMIETIARAGKQTTLMGCL